MKAHTRRNFLRAVAGCAITLPFVRLLEGSTAKAATPTKRLIFFATPNGTVMDAFWPSSDAAYGQILKPLEPMKGKLTVIRGLDMKSAYTSPVPKDHLPDFSNALTGTQPSGQDYGQMKMTGISVDQHIANAIGKEAKFKSLHLGVNTSDGSYPLLSTGPGGMFLPENSPYKSFDRLFADLSGEPDAIKRARLERKSVLDLVAREVDTVRCELGSEDKPRFQAHLDSIRELERSLDFTSATACTAPVLGGQLDVKANANFPAIGKMQMDIVAAAIACDLTRVATLQWSNGASQTHHTWVGVDFTHHGVSHGSEGVSADENTRRGWIISIENWYAKQFLYLAQKLDSMSLLDSTALLWVHEQSNGGSHNRRDMPYVLAGSCGGYFGAGRRLDFKGRAHNDLLITLANAMDVPMTKFGDANATGAISELRA